MFGLSACGIMGDQSTSDRSNQQNSVSENNSVNENSSLNDISVNSSINEISTNSSVNNSVANSTTSTSKKSSSSVSSSTTQNLTTAQKEKIEDATNVLDWQLENGGWGKNYDTTTAFTGYPNDYCWAVGSKFVGTIDNKATYTEMKILAEAYNINGDAKFKAGFDKAFKFLQNLQYSTGGFSQIYPHNGKYNDYVTYNDNAMVSVLYVLQDIANNKSPYQNIADASQREKAGEMIDKAVEYILKSQITIKGEKTAWCAQHDPTTYKPQNARSYELASVSGCESVGIIQFLNTQTSNQEALAAAETARLWLKSKRLENTAYSKKTAPNSFTVSQGSYVWHRFYDITTGQGYFCTRSGKVYYDFAEFCEADKKENGGKYDRATGYDWAGNWFQRAGLNY